MKKLLPKAGTIIFLICLILISIISSATTLYGDDFIYGTYFCNGFTDFINKTAEHYMQMNGRAFIHFILELILIFKDKLFFAVIPLLLMFVFYSFGMLINERKTNASYFALCLSGVMLIPVCILREGMLWMSGAFNYIFPLGLAILGFWTVKKQNKKIPWYCFPIAFIAGASTEQCGMIAIGSSILFLINERINKRKIQKNTYILIIMMLAGFLSIALSPGTSGRIGNEALNTQLSLFERINKVFTLSLSDVKTAFILTAATSLSALNAKKISPIILSAIAFLSALLGAYILSGVILTCTIIFTASVLLIKSDKPVIPIILLAAAGSLGMLAFSTTFGYRNLLPSLLLMIAISAYTIDSLLCSDIKKTIVLVIVFLGSVIIFLPTLGGYLNNRLIINENIKSLTNKNNNEIYYNTEINPICGYNQFFVDNFYYEGIKQIYKIDKDKKIFIQGRDFKDLHFNNVHIENPVYVKNGENYYPLRGILEACGGTASWDNQMKCAVFNLNNNKLYVDMLNSHLFNNEKDYSMNYLLTDDKYGNFFRSNIYLSEKAFSDIFSIQLGENK